MKSLIALMIALLMSLLATPLMAAVPTPSRVVVVVLENHAYGEIIGASTAPYLNGLASRGALFTASTAATHPSQPNYLILFSGSTQGVTDDTVPPAGAPYGTANLGAALLANGHGFIAYSEDLPSAGYLGVSNAGYVRRHAPWSNWQGASANAIPDASSQPLTAFPSDFSALPTVSFVIPNLAHDMHDGTVAQGDQWVHDHLDGFVQWAMANNGLLIVTFDEDDTSAANRVATFFVGPMVAPGSYGQPIGHRDVLRTIEAMYGLPASGSGGAAIDGVWRTGSGSGSSGGGGAGHGDSGHHCGVGGGMGIIALMGLMGRAFAVRQRRRASNASEISASPTPDAIPHPCDGPVAAADARADAHVG